MKRSLLFSTFLLAVMFCLPVVRPASAQDPLKVAPSMYKLVHENARVRVMEVTFKPGAKIAAHSHPDHFVYALSTGKLKISKPQGEPAELEVKVGEVLWIPAETHWAENTGSTEVRLLVTELKEPAPATDKSSGHEGPKH